MPSRLWRDHDTGLRCVSSLPGLAQAPAPIESVEILVLESFPPQYSAVVVSGLRNSCVQFGGYRLDRQGETFHVELLNLEPTDQSRACNGLYRTVETVVPLGSDHESGVEHTIDVNGTTETFAAQWISRIGSADWFMPRVRGAGTHGRGGCYCRLGLGSDPGAAYAEVTLRQQVVPSTDGRAFIVARLDLGTRHKIGFVCILALGLALVIAAHEGVHYWTAAFLGARLDQLGMGFCGLNPCVIRPDIPGWQGTVIGLSGGLGAGVVAVGFGSAALLRWRTDPVARGILVAATILAPVQIANGLLEGLASGVYTEQPIVTMLVYVSVALPCFLATMYMIRKEVAGAGDGD